jgi:hypothetical protein
MYSLLSRFPFSTIVSREVPALGLALVIAELFFKFHSFTLECAGFLATWYGLSWLIHRTMPEKGDR